EALNSQPAIVFQIAQRLEDRLPLDVSGSGDAAIVFTGVHVLQMPAHSAVALGDILLFNVGVEGIEEDPDIGMTDLIAQRRGILRGVEEIRLETVERLDRDG